MAQRYSDDPERVREIARRSYLANAEKRRAAAAKRRRDNRDEVLAYLRDYYQRTRDERLAYARQYRVENAEKARTATKKWFARHPEKKRAYHNAYRARKANASGRFTSEEFRELCAADEERCFYCGRTEPLTADHVVPLSRGGSNEIGNIVPACRPCNSAKRDKTLEEFLGGGWLQSLAA